MVSFVCNHCQQTLKKPKLDPHTYSCRNANFTCIDCNTDFYGTDYRGHTSCISEAQKYQKGLYKGNKNVTKPQPPKKDIIPIQNNVIPADASDKKRSSESESSDNKKQKVDINDETESTKAKKDCSQKVEDLASVIQKAIKEILTEVLFPVEAPFLHLCRLTYMFLLF
ncbi:hypothetical protein DSO57_1029721 [Entomophthora muscae]|uniref:Uncharacterized protein n=1 Tax=Entomophthora muscae TaxID=34485 RepID=A0ACC2TN09_9FUNG|nr:hypothetical protein DSO57_1029721 [Entomophthora muscae]